jgi:hypothetical protein
MSPLVTKGIYGREKRQMEKMPEIEHTARSLYYALSSALRELAVRGATGSESYLVGRKELEEARAKLGIKRF